MQADLLTLFQEKNLTDAERHVNLTMNKIRILVCVEWGIRWGAGSASVPFSMEEHRYWPATCVGQYYNASTRCSDNFNQAKF